MLFLEILLQVVFRIWLCIGREIIFWLKYIRFNRESTYIGFQQAPHIWVSLQIQETDPVDREILEGKIIKILLRGYLTKGVLIVLNYFICGENRGCRYSNDLLSYCERN